MFINYREIYQKIEINGNNAVHIIKSAAIQAIHLIQYSLHLDFSLKLQLVLSILVLGFLFFLDIFKIVISFFVYYANFFIFNQYKMHFPDW